LGRGGSTGSHTGEGGVPEGSADAASGGVELAKQCNTGKQKFLVVGNARVVQTVKLVRLEEFLHLQPNLETALGSLAA
jgi:hypothetical protein